MQERAPQLGSAHRSTQRGKQIAKMHNWKIAGVLTFVRSQWGNDASEVTEEEVATERGDKGVKPTPWTAAELLELYPME